jgi:hypothetical protein
MSEQDARDIAYQTYLRANHLGGDIHHYTLWRAAEEAAHGDRG